MTGWLITDLYNAKGVQPQRGQFDGPRQISINNSDAVKVLKHTYYWSAPEPYLGNKVSSCVESKLLISLHLLYYIALKILYINSRYISANQNVSLLICEYTKNSSLCPCDFILASFMYSIKHCLSIWCCISMH